MDKDTKQKLIIGGGIVGSIIAFVAFKKIRADQQQKAAAKAIVKGGNKALGINVPDIAKQLGIELGYAFPKWHPSYYTENDTAAYILVLKVAKPYIPQLISEYK